MLLKNGSLFIMLPSALPMGWLGSAYGMAQLCLWDVSSPPMGCLGSTYGLARLRLWAGSG